MQIDKELISKVAEVARLKLTDAEAEEFTPQLKEILENFNELDSVDTEGLEPSYQPVKIRNALREDVVKESISQADALKNATHKKDGYFMGPKAV